MAFKIVPRSESHELFGPALDGKRVCRGPDWNWQESQDNYGKSAGTIQHVERDPYGDLDVSVRWDFDGSTNSYDFRSEKHDLDIIDESAAPFKIIDRAISQKLAPSELVGKRVVRGPDWRYSSGQDNDGKSAGMVIGDSAPDRVHVKWEFDGSVNSYQFSPGTYDLDIIDESAALVDEGERDTKTASCRLVPEAEAAKLTAKEIVGRRVMLAERHHHAFPHLVGKIGTVKETFGNAAISVIWESGEENSSIYHGTWEAKNMSFVLIDDGPGKESREIIPLEEACKIEREDLVGRRVIRGRDWNVRKDARENKWDHDGAMAGTITRVSDRVVHVKWDGDSAAASESAVEREHYWGVSDKFEVDILLGKKFSNPKTSPPDEVRPYDPNSKWERPNTLVMALFASEFQETERRAG